MPGMLSVSGILKRVTLLTGMVMVDFVIGNVVPIGNTG